MTTNTAAIDPMIAGRRADSTRRRQRVLTALDNAIKDGAELSVTEIARLARVDRTFLYRHRDLLERIHAAETQPPDKPEIGPSVTRASLKADLLAAQQRCTRMATRTQQLETRLSELLGEQAWRATGLGAPTDIDNLQQRIVTLDNKSSTSACNSKNATKTSPPPVPPTANSSPGSTPPDRPHDTPTQTPAQHLSRTIGSTNSHGTCTNTGDLLQLEAGPPEKHQHSSLGYQPPARYAATCPHQ